MAGSQKNRDELCKAAPSKLHENTRSDLIRWLSLNYSETFDGTVNPILVDLLLDHLEFRYSLKSARIESTPLCKYFRSPEKCQLVQNLTINTPLENPISTEQMENAIVKVKKPGILGNRDILRGDVVLAKGGRGV